MASFNLAQFREVVRRTKHASDPEVRLALSRIAIEAKTRLSDSAANSEEFFQSLRQSLNQLKGNGNADVRISCFLDCAHYFYVSGAVLQGIVATQDGIRLAQRVRDYPMLRKSQTLLGILLADSGSIAQAIEAYVNAIVLARRIGDRIGHAGTLVNLGVALLYASQFDDAISTLTHAEALARDLPDGAVLFPHILANKALCYLYQGRIEEGLECAKESISKSARLGPVNELFSALVREFNYFQLLLEARAKTPALERVAVIEVLADRIGTSRASTLSKISRGLVDIYHGDPARGLDLLLEADSEALTSSPLHRDALVALIKGYEQLGRYRDALERLQQLMNEIRARRGELISWQLTAGAMIGGYRHGRRSNDLQALEYREARLRARVAEDQLAWAQIEMLERLSVTADLREEPTGEHGYRVGRLSAKLAEALEWDSDACLAIDLAARLHDIGKIGIPDQVLLTSQELRDAERRLMRTHTVIGAELLARSNIAQLRMAEEIALYHHEWWDGTGYPKKRAGKRIPIHARIVALADVFDALTHGRPYAEPWSMDRALEEIRSRRGTQFDPELTDCFTVLIGELRAKHKNLDEFLSKASRNSPFLQARRKIKLMLEEEREHERKATVPGNETRH